MVHLEQHAQGSADAGVCTVTKVKTADLIKSHDAMRRFLQSLVRRSDTVYGGNRTDVAQRQYRKAVRLIAKAKELQA
jgi:hypothetical protein